ncbi:MAG: sugar dehydratase [Deltaproteobacteria bacterium HGW-Deltaproteobacteria-2]|jgi:nucleoside-diphosphate-sugar epimerase|nr:MAG: sugar dehydratase [Deltaproteobacteria bacterium HGW-Deltaproteobacteria-2]
MKNVLVIGGSYFVGKVFVEELSRIPDYAIYVMNRGNVPLNIEGVTEIKCDRHDTEAMSEAIPSIEWNAVVDFCAYTPEDISTMISTLPSHAIGQYILISTSSIYEKTNELPIDEEALHVAGPQPGPHGDYAYNKHLAEEELKIQCSENNIPWTIFRPTFIYGKYNYAPREGYFFDLVEADKTIILPDNELALFTFVSVWDVARAIIVCIGNKNAYTKAFNLSGKELISYTRFVDVLRIITRKHISIESMSINQIDALGIPLPFPLDEHLIYSGMLITKDMDFSYTPFVEGMSATYAWYKQKRSGKL